MEFKRSDRIADLLQREIADLLFRRVRDPRLAGLTITGVDVSPDLQNAKIFYCIFGEAGEEEKAGAASGLAKARSFIRQELGKRVQLRYMPQLDFRYDGSFEYGDRIERILKGLRDNE
jgi:ribosome-binding factor A